MFLGATSNEIALTIFLVLLVWVAPMVGRIGEAIGSVFERPAEGSGQDRVGRQDGTPRDGGDGPSSEGEPPRAA